MVVYPLNCQQLYIKHFQSQTTGGRGNKVTAAVSWHKSSLRELLFRSHLSFLCPLGVSCRNNSLKNELRESALTFFLISISGMIYPFLPKISLFLLVRNFYSSATSSASVSDEASLATQANRRLHKETFSATNSVRNSSPTWRQQIVAPQYFSEKRNPVGVCLHSPVCRRSVELSCRLLCKRVCLL